ncbi:MAG: DinB family protein [Bacteroidetes bacterium]|nr:DinB family protein [Bacteroidota bacterium]
MNFDLNHARQILHHTPVVIRSQLQNLDSVWIYSNEGEGTWSPFDILGHLIHGEKTDWMERLQIILAESGNKTFTPFDRFAQFEENKDKKLPELLDLFDKLRAANLQKLDTLNIKNEDLDRKGIHPALGEVTMRNLLSTWVVHDLGHIAQIHRVMAKQWKSEVGPWLEYLPILTR